MASKEKIPYQVRQGDVFLERIEGERPKYSSAAVLESGRVVLAHGEATGHAHVLSREEAWLHDVEDKTVVGDGVWNRLLRVLEGATLRHDCPGQAKPDHESIPLPEGEYRVIQQMTYAPEEIRNVAD